MMVNSFCSDTRPRDAVLYKDLMNNYGPPTPPRERNGSDLYDTYGRTTVLKKVEQQLEMGAVLNILV
jgi:hypothetical protein